MKKTISAVLSILMIIGCCTIFTASAGTYKDFTYETNSTGITLTKCNSSASSVEVPVTINGKTVNVIAKSAFAGRSALKNIYYYGTTAQWKAIKIESGNTYLSWAKKNCLPVNIKLEQTTYIYDGYKKTPAVIAEDADGNAIPAKVTYPLSATDIGTYKATVTFSCEYSGTITKEYKITAYTDKATMIAHRGYSSVAPENTIASFTEAANAGYKYVETDIRLTKDGYWVLMHDASLKRTTTGTGNVADKTLTQIKALTVNATNGTAKYPNEKVPTIDEFLNLCKAKGLKPVIELKLDSANIDYSYVMKAVKSRGIDATFISFNTSQLKLIRALDKNVPMYLLSNLLTSSVVKTAKGLGNCGVDFNYIGYTSSGFKSAAQNGVPLIAWTIDSTSAYNSMYNKGIRQFTTNKILQK